MEGVSFYSCKEWGQNGHYNFKTINEGSLVTDKTVAKAPNVGVASAPTHSRSAARVRNAYARPRSLSHPIARSDGLNRVRARCNLPACACDRALRGASNRASALSGARDRTISIRRSTRLNYPRLQSTRRGSNPRPTLA